MLNFKQELQTISAVIIAVKSRLCQNISGLAKYAGEKSIAIMSKEFAPNAKRKIRDVRRKHLTTLWFFLSLKDVLTMPNTEQS